MDLQFELERNQPSASLYYPVNVSYGLYGRSFSALWLPDTLFHLHFLSYPGISPFHQGRKKSINLVIQYIKVVR